MSELGQQLRVDSVRSSAAANSGHPTSSMSAADLMAVLMEKHLRLDYQNPDNPNNDQLLSSLSVVYPTWRGVALIDADSRALLAAHGETVPLDVLDGVDLDRLTVRPATRPGDVPLMLSAVPLTGGIGAMVAATRGTRAPQLGGSSSSRR